MALNFFKDTGTPLQNQKCTLRELVQKPISKLDDDAFTRVRVILMNGIELEALRFSHVFSRKNRKLQLPLARLRQIEQMQCTTVNWLLGADHSPLMAGLDEITENFERCYREEQEHLATIRDWVKKFGIPQAQESTQKVA